MNNVEQPISQDIQKEYNGEKLHNAGVESDAVKSDRNIEDHLEQVDKGSINLGKFKDAESLLKAYNSLQTEFTKKSQRLSELENSKTEFSRDEKINKAIKDLEQNHDIVKIFCSEIKQSVKDIDSDNYEQVVKDELIKQLSSSYKTANEYAVDEQFLNQFIYNNSTIKDNIIREYLSGLTNTKPVRIVSNLSSSIPVSPPNVPSTIEEAGKLAKNIIKQI